MHDTEGKEIEPRILDRLKDDPAGSPLRVTCRVFVERRFPEPLLASIPR